MVAALSGERIAENADKAFVDDLRIKDILYRTDGRPLVLLEQVKSSSSKAVAGSSPMQFAYQWIYGDAVALCLDPGTGRTLVWWQRVEKKQEVRNSRAHRMSTAPSCTT
jgi:hypothetical protein